MKRPQQYRFSVGDEVTFTIPDSDDSWVLGKVTNVDELTGQRGLHAAYTCEFVDIEVKDKPFHVVICKDNDEHIASIHASARERLFDAIEQHCSFYHLRYLVESSNMDVSLIVEHASYNALLWLKKDLNLGKIRNDNGDGLLHQIAKSTHAERFFEAAGNEWDEQCYGVILLDGDESCLSEKSRNFFLQKNRQGRTWLLELVSSRNRRALELVISPQCGLVWMIARWFCFVMKRGGRFLGMVSTPQSCSILIITVCSKVSL